ncbi:MAG: ArsC/Spx/MgsR family protein [Methylococcaceae bacterium]|jgi:nitrogenase-associated protein
MSVVIFYEKPGCVNNSRQKKLLTAAGHFVIARNLLTEAWQADRLRAFFGDLPVRSWFNYSAPAIKFGEIEPGRFTAEKAINVLIEEPILIRRPLIQIGEHLMVGFDPQTLDELIGLTELS